MLYTVMKLPYNSLDTDWAEDIRMPIPGDDSFGGALVRANTIAEAKEIYFDHIYADVAGDYFELFKIFTNEFTDENKDGVCYYDNFEPGCWDGWYDKEDIIVLEKIRDEFKKLGYYEFFGFGKQPKAHPAEKPLSEVWEVVAGLIGQLSSKGLRDFCFSVMEPSLGIVTVEDEILEKK